MKLKGRKLPFLAMEFKSFSKTRLKYVWTFFFYFTEKIDNEYVSDFWIKLYNYSDTAEVGKSRVYKTAPQIHNMVSPEYQLPEDIRTYKERMIKGFMK